MSAPAKSTSPIAPATNESKDWMKALTPELQSGSKDKVSVLDAKVKERHHCKQVRREEKQRWEEAERLACKEAECKARGQVEKERVELQARAESEQRKVVEVAAKQKAGAQESLKKRAREEPETGPVGEVWFLV